VGTMPPSDEVQAKAADVAANKSNQDRQAGFGMINIIDVGPPS
jgi:hypothetical protein